MRAGLPWLAEVRRALEPAPCPLCGGADRERLLRLDRYLLPVDLSECRACGLVHTARTLSESAMEAFYAAVYPKLMSGGEATRRETERVGRARATLRLERIHALIGPVARVAEIGCGDGYFLEALRDAGATHLFGIEPSPSGARRSAAIVGTLGGVTQAPLSQLAAFPFAPEAIVLFHVLEHLRDPGPALAALARLSAPGTALVVEVPDQAGDWSVIGLHHVHLSHRSYFTTETLHALLMRNGFTPVATDRLAEPVIYPGNLRVVARRADPVAAPWPARDPQAASRVKRGIPPWSPRRGYPRAAIRLLRLALR